MLFRFSGKRKTAGFYLGGFILFILHERFALGFRQKRTDPSVLLSYKAGFYAAQPRKPAAFFARRLPAIMLGRKMMNAPTVRDIS